MGRPVNKGVAEGYRSGLEDSTARDLDNRGVPHEYEVRFVQYTKPAKPSKYTPDFVLPNGIIVETKGRFVTEDRQKHLLVKAQHPDLDIRFVFSSSKARLNKRSPTTYAAWCEKYGFQYADKVIPQAWLDETPNPAAVAALVLLPAHKGKEPVITFPSR